jgi:hypothetical protein
MTSYPLIFYPTFVERARESFPPEPAPPKFSPKPTLQIPPKPEPEDFRELPPKKFLFLPLVFAELSASIIAAIVNNASNSSLAGWLVFLFLTSGVFGWGYKMFTSYPQKLSEYRKKLEVHQNKVDNYPKLVKYWQEDVNKKRIEQKQRIYDWESDKSHLENVYQSEIESLKTPKKILEWRKNAYQQALLSLAPKDLSLGIAEDKRGFAEYPDNCRFPNLIREYFSDENIFIVRMLEWYTPDFAYMDKARKIYIDIEIDEPYTPRQYPNSNSSLILTHCIGADNRRNSFFQSRDWYVIRFSEKQVLCYSDRCCKVIAKVIYEHTGDGSILQQFSQIPDLMPEPAWTDDEAFKKAEKRERLNY